MQWRGVIAIGELDQQRYDRNRKMLSQQKINAVGAAAFVPSTANARPGPCSRYCRMRRQDPTASLHGRTAALSNRPTIMARTNALAVPRVVATKKGGLLSSANGVFDMMRTAARAMKRKAGRSSSRRDLLPAGFWICRRQADEDQSEIRQRQIEDIDHREPSFLRYSPRIRRSVGRRRQG